MPPKPAGRMPVPLLPHVLRLDPTSPIPSPSWGHCRSCPAVCNRKMGTSRLPRRGACHRRPLWHPGTRQVHFRPKNSDRQIPPPAPLTMAFLPQKIQTAKSYTWRCEGDIQAGAPENAVLGPLTGGIWRSDWRSELAPLKTRSWHLVPGREPKRDSPLAPFSPSKVTLPKA